MSPLIPPPELAAPSVRDLPIAKRVELWYELIDEADALVRCGLRTRIGAAGDLEQAYRDWYARKMQQHDADQVRMLERLSLGETNNGG